MRFIFLALSLIIGFLLFFTLTVESAEAPITVLPEVTPCDYYKSIVKQYDWDFNIATQIMMAESGCKTTALNDNPATGDYSVGLFQINLYGSNAKYRPSEAELKDPKTNIEFAYKLYKSSGFYTQWGVCRHSVDCL